VLVVAIETSGTVGSVAVARDRELVSERMFSKGSHHGRDLVPTLDAVFRRHRYGPRDIGLVAAGIGPGSYTGLRVGLAAAKALVFGVGCPGVAVTSFDAMVQNLPRQAGRSACVAVDARRRQVYFARYEASRGTWRRLEGPALSDPMSLARSLAPETIVLGNGVRAYPEAFAAFEAAGTEMWTPRAGAVAALGYEAHVSGDAPDIESAQPLYLRAPAAVEKARRAGG